MIHTVRVYFEATKYVLCPKDSTCMERITGFFSRWLQLLEAGGVFIERQVVNDAQLILTMTGHMDIEVDDEGEEDDSDELRREAAEEDVTDKFNNLKTDELELKGTKDE